MSGSSGRCYVVPGGTGALGRAVVQALLRDGARVAVPVRDPSRFAELREGISGADRLWGASAQIADAASTDAFFGLARDWLGRLDGVACVAGAYAGSGRFEDAPASEWDAMQTANLVTAYAACRAALPRLARGGSVVTVASRTVETGGAGAVAYAVSKAGVIALTRALAAENEERGIRFNCVAPATIDTPENRRAMPKADPSRWTPPEALANVIAFLLSPDSAPTSGAILPVEGPA